MSASYRSVAAGLMALSLAGCDWFTTFSEQPKIDPWEAPRMSGVPQAELDRMPFRGNPQFSVPTTGTFVSGLQVSYSPLPPTIDSMSAIANPTPPSDSSLANGRKYYAINCMVCHGPTGDGQGTAAKYGMVPISLLTPITVGRTDGYMYGMIRNGRGLMPSYNRIEEMDRWDVVNYVRGLQGRLPSRPATGALAPPGVTGDAVPGVTRLGPTRPVADWAPMTRGGNVVAPASPGGMLPPAGAADSAGRARAGAGADTTARRDTTQRRGATP